METFRGDTVQFAVSTDMTLTGMSVRLKFRRPNGSVGFWDGTIDPSDNTVILYTTDVNDLNMPGVWTLQAFAYSGSTVRLHGKKVNFTVSERFSDTTLAPTTAPPTTPVP
jgi:hypothetical protein